MRISHLGLPLLLNSWKFVAAQQSCTTVTSCSTTITSFIQPTITVSDTSTPPVNPGYNTVSAVYRGTGTLNPAPHVSTIAQPNGVIPGTVEILYNPATNTITVLDNGVGPRTSTVATQVGPTPGSVDVLLPSYVTITTTSGYANTRITASPIGTVQGTVSVVIPSSTVVYCNLYATPATASPNPTATGSTSNKGVQYGLWTGPFFDSPPFNADNGFANYDVQYFDASNRAALHLGRTQTIGDTLTVGVTSQRVYADSTQAFPTQNITLIHRGFLYARTAGTYSFTSINPDDIVLLWVGQYAVSGFTRANSNMVKAYPAGTTTHTVNMTAGEYIPFRVQWANGGLPGYLGFRITSPTNQVLFDVNGSTDIVTGACDGSTVGFPQWT